MKSSEQKENDSQVLKNRKQKHRIIGALIIISLILIGIGTYLNLLGNPKRIMASALNNLSTQIQKIVGPTEIETGLEDNYSINSDIKVNLESETLTKLAQIDPTYQPYLNLFTNINQTQNKVKMVQNKKEKQFLFSLESIQNKEPLINTKYLIQNSTQYYWVKGFLTTYINSGSSNYFESLDSSTTTQENMTYLYNFILKSAMNHCKTDDFKMSQVLTSYQDSKVKYTKISLTINNHWLRTLATDILKDLKEDKQANKILTSLNPNFSKTKIKENTNFLKDREEITVNIYTDNFTYQIKKYEVIQRIEQDTYSIIYEKRQTEDYAYLIKNDQIQYQFQIKSKDSQQEITVYTKEKERIGTISLETTSKEKIFNVNMTLKDYQIIGKYQMELSNLKKGKSYQETHHLSLKIMDETQIYLNAGININSKVSEDCTVKEDVSKSVLESSLKPGEKQNLEQYWTTILTKLES